MCLILIFRKTMDYSRLLENNLYVRVFLVGELVIDPSWWRYRYTNDLFWRFYRNAQDGAFLTIRDERITLQAGQLYIIPAHLPLELSCETAVHHFFVHFDVVGLPDIALRELFGAPFGLPAEPGWERLIREVIASLDPNWPYLGQPMRIAAQCQIKGVLYEALGRYLQSVSPERIARCWYLAERLGPVLPAITHIERHLAGDLSNPCLARECSMSEGHFIRTFRACVGQTPAQYVLECRVKAASRRLLLTSETIDEVADRYGFGSRHYFSRMFARQTGQSPAAFRRSRQ